MLLLLQQYKLDDWVYKAVDLFFDLFKEFWKNILSKGWGYISKNPINFNDMLFVSGQIPLDPISNKLVDSGIVDETNMVMKNIDAILKEANMSFDDIVKASIFLKNMDDFNEVNEIYSRFFEEPYPSRETVEVSRLPKDANIEISFIAGK